MLQAQTKPQGFYVHILTTYIENDWIWPMVFLNHIKIVPLSPSASLPLYELTQSKAQPNRKYILNFITEPHRTWAGLSSLLCHEHQVFHFPVSLWGTGMSREPHVVPADWYHLAQPQYQQQLATLQNSHSLPKIKCNCYHYKIAHVQEWLCNILSLGSKFLPSLLWSIVDNHGKFSDKDTHKINTWP